MRVGSHETAKQILSSYLEQNNCRKTPERFAILEAIYGLDSYFSIQELGEKLARDNFPVSRATLYNTIKLLMRLRLVVALRLRDGIRYKASVGVSASTQVCTMCGKTTDIEIPEVEQLLSRTRLRRFRQDGHALFVYGVCSTCQATLTRFRNKKEKTNKK